MLLHTCYQWADAYTPELWPFALKPAVELNNATPGTTVLSPEEIFTGRKSRCRLNDFHTFGCPVFVLIAGLHESGGSIPKWEPRSRMAVYIGLSPDHTSNVPLVLSTRTGLVMQQYHVVYDDHFMTTRSLHTNVIPSNWKELFTHRAENVLSDDPEKAAIHDLRPHWDDSPMHNTTSTTQQPKIRSADEYDQQLHHCASSASPEGAKISTGSSEGETATQTSTAPRTTQRKK